MTAVCVPCAMSADHIWHDDGSPFRVVDCADISGDYSGQKVLREREQECEAGRCVCEERTPMETNKGNTTVVVNNQAAPTPRTPRIEAGEKVVLPDGQVRKIKSVRHVLADNNRDTTRLIVELTDRWLPDAN